MTRTYRGLDAGDLDHGDRARDWAGNEIRVGDRVLTRHADTHEDIVVTIDGIDMDPRRGWVVDFTTPDGEPKWGYANNVEIIR